MTSGCLIALDFFTGDRLLGRRFNEASANDLGIDCFKIVSSCLRGESLFGPVSNGGLKSSSIVFQPLSVDPSLSGIIGLERLEANMGGFGVSTRSTTSASSKQPSASLAAIDQRFFEDLTAFTEVPSVVQLGLVNKFLVGIGVL